MLQKIIFFLSIKKKKKKNNSQSPDEAFYFQRTVKLTDQRKNPRNLFTFNLMTIYIYILINFTFIN